MTTAHRDKSLDPDVSIAGDVADPLSEEAFKAMYVAEWPRIVDYLRFRIGPVDADDVAAEIFTKAWAARKKYDADRGEPTRWLWGITRNQLHELHRSRARSGATELHDRLVSDLDVESSAARIELLERVGGAMSRLNILDQEIVALRFGAGFSHREIGGIVGLAEGAVGQRLHRLVRQLRVNLEGDSR